MWKRVLYLFTLCVALLGASSCSALWNKANVGSLEADLQTLLAGAGIDVELQRCSMVGSTRSGYCRFQDLEGVSGDIVEHFNLAPLRLENATIPFIDAEFEAGCGSYAWILDGSGGELYLVSGRPTTLSLESGAQFEYLLLVFEQSSGEACIQVSYSYG